MKSRFAIFAVVLVAALVAWTFALRHSDRLRFLLLTPTSDAIEPAFVQSGPESATPSDHEPSVMLVHVPAHTQRASGIKLGRIERIQWNFDRILPAKLELDPGRHYAVTAPADVVVEELLCPLGSAVQRGDPLIEMSSSHVTMLRGNLARQQLLTQKARKSVQWHREIQSRVNDIIANIDATMDQPSRDWLPPASVQTAEYGAKILSAYTKYWASSQIAKLSERVVNSGVMAEKSMIERNTDSENAKVLLRGVIEQSRFDLQQAILSAESDLVAADGALQSSQSDMRRYLGLRNWNESIASKPHHPESPDRFIHYSPGSGLVLERYFANSERATEGELVVLVADIRTLWCVGELRQGDWDLLKVKSGDSIAAVIVGLESLGPLAAKIEMVGGTVQSDTGSIRLTASLENEELRLRPGMIARLVLTQPSHAIVVPASAVFSNDGTDYLVKQESDEDFRLVAIETGRRTNTEVEILNGAELDWRILVEGVFPIASQAFLEKE